MLNRRLRRSTRDSNETAGAPLLKPRWAPNGYGIGGVAMLVGGVAIIGVVLAIAEVRQEVGWLSLMGGAWVVAGGIWAWLTGRWGRLKDSPRAARDGVAGQAVIVAVHQTAARRKTGEYGRTTHRVVGLDLDVEAVGIARYRLRVYRSLPVRLLSVAAVGGKLGVCLLPGHPRRIALAWPEPDPSAATTLTVSRQEGRRHDLRHWAAVRYWTRHRSAGDYQPLLASARIDAIRDIPSHGSPSPIAEYDLTVSIPGHMPYAVRIHDRGPATANLVGTDVPVTVGADPRLVTIVWGPAA